MRWQNPLQAYVGEVLQQLIEAGLVETFIVPGESEPRFRLTEVGRIWATESRTKEEKMS